MRQNSIFKIGLLLSAALFVTGLVLLYNDQTTPSSILLISSLALMAVSFQGFEKLRGFSYTFWILTA
ncbi:MAG: hypothetical protein WEB30_15125, partial [Cyclobacteriaceae bacterium]